MRKNLVFTPLMVLLAAGSSVVYGQDLTSAVLAGRVTSRDGQPLRNVRVLVNSPALLSQRQATTDANGQFRMPILPAGVATVTYILDGYITRRLTVNLTAGQVANANAAMTAITAQEETVDIIGTTTQIDKTDTVVQVSFTGEKMNELMRAGSLTEAHALVPAVANANLWGTPNIRGGTNRSTKILYNGIPVTEMFGGYMYNEEGQAGVFVQDLIESFAVLLSPSNARYGNSDGGLVSMVSKKGSNEFKGSLRVVDLRRNYWETINVPYPRRDGSREGVGTVTPAADSIRKRYEFTLEGPIWKDRVSFAYGGILRPSSYWEWWPGRQYWSNPIPQYSNYVGTFFQNEYGDVVRRSELGVRNDVNNLIYKQSSSTANQFTVFAQLTPNHQVEYFHKQVDYAETNGWGDLADFGLPGNGRDDDALFSPTFDWAIAYKGIIGSSGVLDFRYGKHTYYTHLTNAAGTRVVVGRLPSYVTWNNTLPTTSELGDPENFPTSGFVNAAYDSILGIGNANYEILGKANDTIDGGITTSITLNYQHMLSTAIGNHLIDVGYQSDHLEWWTKNYDSATFTYTVPGRLYGNLSEADVYRNPNDPTVIGTGNRLPAAAMAGQFIMWNMRHATLNSIDPYGVQWAMENRPGAITDPNQRLFVPATTGLGGVIPQNSRHLSEYYPRLRERYGNDSGTYYTQMQSYYINDLWSINDNHSVMLGLRFDMYKVWDTVKDVHSYTQPTFRLDYKWDIYGDQRYLVNVSFNQYHNLMSANTFMPFVEAKQLNVRQFYWDQGPTDGRPYLVPLEEVINKNNYNLQYSDDVAGSMGAQVDPDWKAPYSNEFGISFARNFSNGGSFKISYIQRSWTNLYDIFPGDIVQMPNGMNQMKRVLKNTDEFERSYKGIEIEWNVPLSRRLVFAGNYTYARFMHNQSGIGTTADDLRNAYSGASYQMPEYWDQFWPRETWRPIRLAAPEHMFNWWFNYNLTTGKTKSSLAIRGRYDTNGYGYRQVAEVPGRPVIDGVYDYNGNVNTSGLSTGYWIARGKSKNDGAWNTTLRYNLELPLYRRLAWFFTAEVWNPFNHRGRSGSGIVGFQMSDYRYPRNFTEPNGTVYTQRDPYPDGNLYRQSGDAWSMYTGRQSGRTLTVQTGLRF